MRFPLLTRPCVADNLKDLLRFLRRDDPQSREVFKQVCKWNIVGKDLIPIFEHCQDDHNLVLNAGIATHCFTIDLLFNVGVYYFHFKVVVFDTHYW